MIYCLDCGARLDGEQDTFSARLDGEQDTFSVRLDREQATFSARLNPDHETFVSNMLPGLPTFVGSVPIPRSKRRVWAVIAFIGGLLTVGGAYIYIGEMSGNSVELIPQRRSATETVQDRAGRTGVPQPTRKTVASLPPPSPTTAPTALKPPIATDKRLEHMQVRIEIIDGIYHCYAIPGGREIPCR